MEAYCCQAVVVQYPLYSVGMKVLIDIFSLKKNSRTRGHEVTLVKEVKISVDWTPGSTHSHRGQ